MRAGGAPAHGLRGASAKKGPHHCDRGRMCRSKILQVLYDSKNQTQKDHETLQLLTKTGCFNLLPHSSATFSLEMLLRAPVGSHGSSGRSDEASVVPEMFWKSQFLSLSSKRLKKQVKEGKKKVVQDSLICTFHLWMYFFEEIRKLHPTCKYISWQIKKALSRRFRFRRRLSAPLQLRLGSFPALLRALGDRFGVWPPAEILAPKRVLFRWFHDAFWVAFKVNLNTCKRFALGQAFQGSCMLSKWLFKHSIFVWTPEPPPPAFHSTFLHQKLACKILKH